MGGERWSNSRHQPEERAAARDFTDRQAVQRLCREGKISRALGRQRVLFPRRAREERGEREWLPSGGGHLTGNGRTLRDRRPRVGASADGGGD